MTAWEPVPPSDGALDLQRGDKNNKKKKKKIAIINNMSIVRIAMMISTISVRIIINRSSTV